MIEAARIAMPNVSDMAENGAKMTNAFVAHPVWPSRARYLYRTLARQFWYLQQ